VSLMEQPSGGIILMIASGAGVLGGSSSVAYAASKGGVHGFGLTLVGQLKPLNIRVHVILPGNMATTLKLNVIGEIAEKAGESRKGAIKAQLPGLLKPEITAELLTNLVSDIGTSAQDTLLIQSAEWAKIFEDQKRST
nr:SDR family oxidoreductase [Candidatus Poribacteria bacterium]